MGNIAIYIAMHKPYRSPKDTVYVPIQVGADLREPFCDICDNTGDNISDKNRSFCEQTALYWIWKNTTQEIVGLVHYRRYFSNWHISFDPWKRILTKEKLEAELHGVDILLPKKRNYFIETNYSQYAHYEKDLILCRDVLSELCPEYLYAFDTVMQRRSGHRFNMMITKRNAFDYYCQWLFPILFELENVSTPPATMLITAGS